MKGVIHPELVAELREARIASDKLRIECAKLREHVATLEEVVEAQRQFIAWLTLCTGIEMQ